MNSSGSVIFINAVYLIPAASGVKNVNNNSVVTAFTKAIVGGTNYGIYGGAGSSTQGTLSYSNNNFSNLTLTGATSFQGIYDLDYSSAGSTCPIKNINGNIFNNWTNSGAAGLTGIGVSDIKVQAL